MAGARAEQDKAASDTVESVSFKFYQDEEIRRISVKKITKPDLLDSRNIPVPDGLYDPALGPINDTDSCKTCGQLSVRCHGHCGHIELARPIYNPLLFRSLQKLVKSTCFACSAFRANQAKVKRHTSQLERIVKGDIIGARALESLALSIIQEDDEEEEQDINFKDESSADSENSQRGPWTSLQYTEALIVIAKLMSGSRKKCNNCSYRNPAISCPNFGWPNKNMSSSNVRANIISGSNISPNTEEQELSETDENSNVEGGKKKIAGHSEDEIKKMLSSGHQQLLPTEAEKIVKQLWQKEAKFCELICDLQQRNLSITERKQGYKMFFLKTLLVPPSKFRPPAGDLTRGVLEHPQNVLLSKVINANALLQSLIATNRSSPDILKRWMELQKCVNILFDNTKGMGKREKELLGYRQLLEKKAGILRQRIMGKRVDFACRSVISPDPYLAVNEIGIPPYFAMKLTYPERVTPWNVKELRIMVINGADIHPGATHYREKDTMYKLQAGLSTRYALSKSLFASSGSVSKQNKAPEAEFESKTVYRHLHDGDIVLVNRQPTLHKPSMKAHVVRVLLGEKTIRMHYANCSTYNADFDGDEMNVHVPQDEISRSEAFNIVDANKQYVVPTSGDPARGLIQDHIVSAVLLTKLDTFLNQEEYHQLLYGSCLPNTSNTTILGKSNKVSTILSSDEIQPVPPAILKPKPLWTGKQVITAILNYITRGRPPFTVERKGRIPKEYLQDKTKKNKNNNDDPCDELTVYIHDNELVKGIIDKAQFGNFGIVHSVYEFYGADAAGNLLSIFSRLFTLFLQMYGFTCGVDDLLVDRYSDSQRRKILDKSESRGEDVHARFTGLKEGTRDPVELQKEVEKVIRRNGESAIVTLDRMMSNSMNALTSEVNQILFPQGLQKPFTRNCLSLMTTTGAKGGLVNMTQISSLLGQQELEGKRVPRMISGKTLPSFAPWDTSSRSGGFISDRFLTGLRPQEYYFHCMAGRDGLVDTAIKTSRSGYLQRCLIKNLECLKVSYDFTVRDADGSIVQFRYGEDGVDVSKTSFLSEFRLLADNRRVFLDDRQGSWLKDGDLSKSNSFIKELPSDLKEKANNFVKLSKDEHKCRYEIKKKELMKILKVKYISSLAEPGEAVGVLAAQSIGEPSTQMTLNTFHLAGRGDMNVTLGIPRLQEILMTASKDIRTPVMKCPLLPGTSREDAEGVAAKLRRICVADVVERMEVCTVPFFVKNCRVSTVYKLKLKLYPSELYPPHSDLTLDECRHIISTVFVGAMEDSIQKHLNMLGKMRDIRVVGKAKEASEGDDNDDDDDGGERNKDGGDGDGADSGNEDQGADAERRRRQERDEIEYEDDPERDEKNGADDVGPAGDVEEKSEIVDQEAREVGEEEGDGDYAMGGYKEEEKEEKGGEEEKGEEEEEEEEKKDSKESKKKKKVEGSMVEEDEEGSKKKKKKKKRTIHVHDDGLECEIHYKFDLDEPRVLLAEIAQRTAKSIYVRASLNIDRCSVADPEKKGDPPTLQTAGVNFSAFWNLHEYLDINRVTTNNIHSVLNTYGVEAARATIINEVGGVFKAYGISVNTRHLSLIADFMTFHGGFRPMNRLGMGEYSTSPFGKMTFETATKFIVGSAFHGEVDTLQAPSASVSLGQPVKVGTGCFDLMQKI